MTSRSTARADAPARPTPEDDRPSGLALAALLAAMVAGFAILPRFFGGHESAMAGKDAPDVALKFVANAPASGDTKLSALKGHPVLLDFWATWCGPCQAEAPLVDKVSQHFRDQGLTVIGVNTSDEAGNAAPWARAHGISYPIAFDEGQHAAAAYGVQNLPTLVLISSDGHVKAVRTGMTSVAELEALVKTAL